MTKNDFVFMIETQQPLEFTYNGKVYNLTYDKNPDGSMVIIFGQLYEGVRYNSIGELLNTAKIENHYFREMLDIIK